MKIAVLAVGKVKEAYFRAAEAEYVGRLGHHVKLEVRELPSDDKLVRAVPAGAHLVALDSRGTQASSEELAGWIAHEEQHGGGRPVVFVIGGAEGLPRSLVDRADRTLAFGRITLPHRLARIVLLEQLYRAFSILRGDPYHK